jgi:photosystem II stability/assembly factor-like uncharacterized protein
MKKISFLLLTFFFSYYCAQAQTWTRLQSWGLDLETIFWVNDSVAYAGGERLLIKTSNAGQTWEELPYQFDGRVVDLVFKNSNLGLAVGNSGLILKTVDGGNSWSKINIGQSSDFHDISYNGENNWIISGSSGKIFESTNDGTSWQEKPSSQTKDIFGVEFINKDTVYAVGQEGLILRSYNKGASWTSLNSGVTESLHAVRFSSPLIGYAAGDNGRMIKTIDGGNTWQLLNTGTTVKLNDLKIAPRDVRIIVAVGDNATSIRSTNSGSSFARANLGATNTRNILGLSFLPGSNTVFASGKDGYLISSTNAASTYTQRLAGFRNNFTSVDFKTDRVGFVAGERGEFLVTSNSGVTFISRPIPEQFTISAIDFWNTAFGYISGPGGKIYRTSNSGSAWGEFSINTTQRVDGFYLFAPSVLYLAGTNGFITRSSDSGGTWDLGVTSNSTTNLKDLMFFDFAIGIAIGENGLILYSFGGGQWEPVNSGTNRNLNGLAKLGEFQAIAVGDGGTIIKTEDKSQSWRSISSGTNEDLLSVDFFDSQFGFISGKNGLALVTKDGGESWTKIETGTNRNLNAISAGTPLIAYAAGDDGSILTYNCVPPTGALSNISGAVQTCLESQTYRITNNQIAGTQLVWRVDGGQIINGQGTNTVEVEWTDPGRKAIFVSRSNFCGAGETSFLEVNVSQLPPANLKIDGNGTVCETNEESYQLPNLQGISYTWEANGGEILSGQGTSTVLVKWINPGLGSLKATPKNACGQRETITLPIQINALPTAPDQISGENLVPPGEQTYSVAVNEGHNYQWSLSAGGRILEGQGTGTIRVRWESEGNFEVQVRAQNSCNFSEEIKLGVQVSLITSLEPNSGDSTLKIYPNPSEGDVFIESDFLDTWNWVEVSNQRGQVVFSTPISPGLKSIRLTDLPKGLLIFRLSNKDRLISKKIWIR